MSATTRQEPSIQTGANYYRIFSKSTDKLLPDERMVLASLLYDVAEFLVFNPDIQPVDLTYGWDGEYSQGSVKLIHNGEANDLRGEGARRA